MPASNLKVLIGWKEIAAYLGCSRSTAVRRLDDGLPVFRVGGSVRAFAADIDRWLEGERLRKMEDERQADVETAAIVVKDSEIVETVAAYVREGKGQRYAVVPLGVDTSEYERIEDHLKKTEEKSRWVLETIPVWVWETDAQNEFTYSNVASVDMLGYRPEELVGFKPSEFLVHQEDVPTCENAFGQIRKKKDAVRNLRCRFVTRENDVRWFEVDAEPAFDAHGKFAGTRGVSRDVTGRVRAEAKEKEHLAILSFLSRTANDFVAFGPEGDLFAYVAERLQELVGDASVALTSYDETSDTYTVRAVANLGDKTRAVLKAFGKNIVGMVFPSNNVMTSRLMEGKLFRSDIPLHEITRGLISKKLNRKLQEILGFSEIYIMGIVRYGKLLGLANVTPTRGTRLRNPEVVEAFINQAAVAIHRQHAEEAYRESEERYRSLFEESPAAVTVFDADGTIVDVNEAAEGISGYPREVQLGTKLEEIPTFDASYVPELKNTFSRVLAGEEVEPFEIPITRNDGERRWLYVRPALTKTAGDRSGIQVIAVDVTERKRAEAARERERTAFQIIAEVAVGASEARALCGRVVGGLVAALGFDFGTAEQFDPATGFLTSACAVGLSEEQLAEKEVPVSLEDERHLSAYTARRREGLFVPDVREHPINETHGEWLEEIGVRGFISWPLIGAEDQLLGVLQLGSRTPKVFAEGDQVFFATVAGMFAAVLERRRAEEALRRSEEFNRAAIEHSPLGISVRDRCGRLLNYNERWPAIWAIPPEELRRELETERDELRFDEGDEYLKDWQDDLRRVYAEGGHLHIPEIEIPDAREGGAQWVNHYFYTIKDEKGDVDRVVVLTEDITARKRAQEDLAESEEKFRTLVERSNDGIAIIVEGRLAYVNPRISEVSGYASEEMLGEPFALFIDPAELPKVKRYYEQRKRGENTPAVYETAIRCRDGSKLYVEFNVGSVQYRGQSAMLAFIRDLTERRRALELTHLQHELAQKLAAAASLEEAAQLCVRAALRASGLDSGGMYAVDASSETGELIYQEGLGKKFVKEVSHYEGMSPHAQLVLEGKPRFTTYEELGVPVTAAQTREGLKAVGVIPITHEGEAVACLNVGSHTAEAIEPWAQEALKTIAAQVGGALARLRTQKALAESEEKFRNLVERSNDGVAIVDDGRLVYVNPRICEATGYAPEEMFDQPFARFVDPAEIPTIENNYKKRMRGEDVPPIYETVIRRADGSALCVELNVGMVPYRGQTAELVFIRDLTERMKAEAVRERERQAFRIIAEAAVQAKSIRGLCRRVVTGLAEALEFEIGTIRLYEEKTETLERTASYGITRDEMDNFFPTQPLDDPRYFASHVARTHEPIFAPDVTKHDIAKKHRPRIDELGWAAVISWPILGAGGVLLGVINLASRTPKDIAEEDRVFFETVAGMFATVLERRRAEDEVRKSEAKHRLLLESIGSPVLALDYNMNILYYNDAYAACMDLPHGEVEGKNILEVLPSFAETKSYKAYAEALSTGTPREAEGEFGGRYLRTAVYPMPWGILAVATDITERRHAEEALRDSEALYRELVETSPDSITFADLEGNILAINRPATDMVGLDNPAKAVGKNVLDFVPREKDKAAALADIGRIVAEGTVMNVSYDLQRADGTVFPSESNASLVRGAGGKPKGIILITRDITERRSAEKALRESEEKFRNLAEESPNMIFINSRGKVVYANKRCEEVMGYTREEFYAPDFDFLTLIDPASHEIIREAYAAHSRGEDVVPYEYTLVTKAGGHIEAIITAKLVAYEGESAILGIVTDITARKRALEALSESEERYRVLFEGGNDAIFVFNLTADGKPSTFVEVNNEACLYLGYSAAELHRLTAADLVPPERRKAAAEMMRRLVEEKELIFEWVHLRKDGTEIPVEISTHLFEFRGEPTVISIVRDITERKRAQEELRRETEFGESIINTAVDTVFVFDPQTGKPLRWNKAFSEISGYSDEEIAAMKAPDDWYSPEDLERAATTTEEIFDEGSGTVEMALITKDGGTVPTEYVGSLVKDTDGNPQYIISVGRDITERKRAEKALRESEEKYRATVEQARDGIIIVVDGKLAFVNDYYATMLGYAKEDLIGRPIFDMVPPRFREGFAAMYEQAVENGVTPEPVDALLLTADGREIPAETVSADVTYAGSPAILVVIRDISERRAAEAALVESEEKFRLAFESAKDAIFWAEPETGIILECNKAAETMLEKKREDIVGHHQSELHPPEKADYYGEMFQQHIEQKKAVGVKAEVITESGKEIPVEITASLTLVGEKPIIQGIFRDVTERHRAEEALRESEEKYHSLADNVPVGIFRSTAERGGRLLSVNPALAQMFGYDTPEDMAKTRVVDFYADREDRQKFIETVRSAGVVADYEVELKTADGSTFLGSLSARAVKGPDGDIAYIDGVLEDITERKRAEEALRKSEQEIRGAEREKTAILSSMSELVVYHDTELTILWANEAAASSVGQSPENLIGRHCYEVWHGREKPCEICPVVAAFETGGPHEEEVTSPDGRVWFIRGYPIKDENGNATNAVEVTLEITDRKRAEDDLKHALAENEAMLEAVPDLMFVIDREGYYVDFKRAEADQFALPPETIIGKNVRDTGLSAEDEREVLAEIERTLRTGETTSIAYELETPRGQGTFEARLVKMNDDEVLAVVRRITQP